MVIDCHGHYTTAPKELQAFREAQIAALTNPAARVPSGPIHVSDDQLRESVQPQLKFQSDRGTDVTIFSPRASRLGDGASHWRRAHEPGLVAALQRSDSSRV
jgi:4-oxalmesaconate hydratase